MSTVSRRSVLRTLSTGLLVPMLPGLTLGATAQSTRRRFVLVILRGALDGLAAVPPWGDADLQRQRAALLVPEPQLLKLDSHFALHPSLGTLHKLYQQREAELFHAVATPYRERSHFDAQNVLETGLDHPDPGAEGWLNQLLSRLNAGREDSAALALGQTMPKVLQGVNTANSWTPDNLPTLDDDLLTRLRRLYASDALLGLRLEQGLRAQELVGAEGMLPGNARNRNLQTLASAAARFLAQDNGPVIAVIDSNGWDTHANQGALRGQLAQRLGELDAAIANLYSGLGDYWSTTQVLVVTEFGRTVKANGTGGTDHGTGSVAFRLGGVDTLKRGGAVHADWPGLGNSQLLEGRDLRPTLDLRELFADAAQFLTEGLV